MIIVSVLLVCNLLIVLSFALCMKKPRFRKRGLGCLSIEITRQSLFRQTFEQYWLDLL